MKRKLFVLLICLLITAMCLGCEHDPNKDFQFEINEDGKSYTLVKYDYLLNRHAQTDIVIPTQYNGLPVTKIDAAFSGYTELRSVVIPEGVEIIGNRAFAGCKQLSRVDIPKSVYIISEEAFYDCDSLIDVYIQQPVDIKGYAFYSCDQLKTVNLCKSSTNEEYSIGKWAFDGCYNLEIVNLGLCYVKIERAAFRGCKNLKTVYLSSNITEIETRVFESCENLKDIYLDVTEEAWNNIDTHPFWIDFPNNITFHFSDEDNK